MKRLFLISTILVASSPAFAQQAGMQSPAYTECTSLAASNPTQALAKADAWLKIDTGIAAQHCRAMALYGLKRYAETGDALAAVHDSITTPDITLRSYVARQAAHAYLNANAADKALVLLSNQINDIGTVHGDNANAAKLTSELLLDRARLNVTYGKLDDAAKDLDHAVSLTPINEAVLMERAGVFEKLGDLPLARNDLDAVLTINSSNSDARLARDRLNGKQISGTGIAVPATIVASPAQPSNAAPTSPAVPTLPQPAPQDAANAAPVMGVSSTPANAAQPQSFTPPSPLVAPVNAPVAKAKHKSKKHVKKKTTTTASASTTSAPAVGDSRAP